MTDFLYCKKSDKVEFAPTSCHIRHILSTASPLILHFAFSILHFYAGAYALFIPSLKKGMLKKSRTQKGSNKAKCRLFVIIRMC